MTDAEGCGHLRWRRAAAGRVSEEAAAVAPDDGGRVSPLMTEATSVTPDGRGRGRREAARHGRMTVRARVACRG